MILFDWTDERVEELKRRWAEGVSATKIAEEMGPSRSAVLGKLHRLGLNNRRLLSGVEERQRQQAGSPPRASKRERRSSKNYLTLTHGGISIAPEPVRDGPTARTAAAVDDIISLTEDTCRWPVGDPLKPGFFFCGEPPRIGCPYCPKHAAIAYDGPPRDTSRPRQPYVKEQPNPKPFSLRPRNADMLSLYARANGMTPDQALNQIVRDQLETA